MRTEDMKMADRFEQQRLADYPGGAPQIYKVIGDIDPLFSVHLDVDARQVHIHFSDGSKCILPDGPETVH